MERSLVLQVAEEHRLDRAALAPLLEHRKQRRARLGVVAAGESALEKIEGTARFVDQNAFTRSSALEVLRKIEPTLSPWTLEKQLKQDHTRSRTNSDDQIANHDLAELLDEELSRTQAAR